MKRMISGIKPSGALTLGNFIGAIKPFVSYQDKYELFVFIADLHALTVYQKPEELKENTINLIATYLAAGLDPEKCTLFKQSDILEHNQLEWILTCNTQLPDLTKMPQFKSYQEKHKNEAVPSGMLLYPSLMNADILLYDVDYVPVGEDQVPHVLLTRTVADKFNKKYGETFKLPEPTITKCGAKIMSLSDPTKKMSKSESDKGTIYLLDDECVIRNKIKKALTDSEDKVYYNPETKPGISNLMTIYSALTGKTFKEIETEFKDIPNYGVFKNAVADVVCTELKNLQSKIAYIKQSNIINSVLEDGCFKASLIAEEKRNEVYTKVGLM